MKDIEITLIGPNPDETQGGGVRTRTLSNVVDLFHAKTNRVYYSFQKDRFTIREGKKGVASYVEIDVPNRWVPLLKAASLPFITAYTWKVTKKSTLIFCTFGSMLFAIPPVVVSVLRRKPIVLDYIDTELYGVPEPICAYFLKKADLVFAISHYLVDQAVRYGAQKVVHIPTFVDTDFFRADYQGRLKYRELFQVKPTDVVIGYAGSLAPFEGLPFLLEAVKRLLPKYVNIKLVIVGKKLLPSDCDIPKIAAKLGVEKTVRLQAPVPREEYPKLLSSFDILCVPRADCLMSRAANPIKVTEYMSMGVPTVCSSVGEIALIIKHGINGFLTKPSDPSALEKTLEYVISNPENAQDVGKAGRKEVIEKYRFEIIADRIRNELMQIVTSKE